MAKEKETAKTVEVAKREFFFPPQDGRPAFVCEAKDKQEAEKLYSAQLEN